MPRSARQTIRWSTLLALGLVPACSHSEPFAGETPAADRPFQDAAPARLTYNAAADVAPAWLPDGSGLLYSFGRPESPDGDRCIGLLPPTGGTLRRAICERSDPGHDTTTSYGEPAAGPGGLLAYTRMSVPRGAPAFGPTELVVAPLDEPLAATLVTRLPRPGTRGRPLPLLRSLRWLGPSRLAFVAGSIEAFRPGGGGDIQLPVWQDIFIADLTPGGPVLRPLPGLPGNPTSLSAGDSPDVLYYTVAGDSRVFRQGLSDAAPAVAHDFGAGHVPRDVDVRDRRLVAVVDGKLGAFVDPTFGVVQRDGGGAPMLVDLGTGAARPAALPPDAGPAGADGLLFSRPVLAPSGEALVAEGVPFVVVDLDLIRRDTTLTSAPDLWLLAHP